MKHTLAVIFLFNSFIGLSQTQLTVNNACSYYGEKTPTSIYSFSSDNEAESSLKLITDASGLAPNFKIVAGNVPNACATMIFNKNSKQLERYIIYNQTFMYNISQKINYWASISILAHEVGHHLNGHSLQLGGSRPSLELEADKFSGFILAKLGATLEEAQAAINSLVSESGSATHPPKSARLAAIANGWYQNNQNSSTNSIGSSNKKMATRPSYILCGDEKLREQVYLTKTNTNTYKLISEKGYEFSNSEYDEIKINDNIKIFWFNGYTNYGYIDNFNEITTAKPTQLKIGHCTVWLSSGGIIWGNSVIVYYPNKTFHIIFNGKFASNPQYISYDEEEIMGHLIRKYYYKISYGSKSFTISVDLNKIEEASENKKIIIGMGVLEN